MAERYFPRVQRWVLSPAALHASREEMALDGREGNEGTALWLGRRQVDVAVISAVVRLRGDGIVKAPDYLSISMELINEVTDVAASRGEVLLGQIHSHGWRDTNLSPVDRAGGFRVPCFLSVVAPNFARKAELDLRDCGVHVYSTDGWRRLAWSEVERSIELTGGAEIDLVTVSS